MWWSIHQCRHKLQRALAAVRIDCDYYRRGDPDCKYGWKLAADLSMAVPCRRWGRATSFSRKPPWLPPCRTLKSTIKPSNQSVAVAGDTAIYQVTLTPRPIFTTNISLSCSNLPSAAACNFTNNPATLSTTSGATSTLNLTTTARPIVTPAASLSYATFLCYLADDSGIDAARNRRRPSSPTDRRNFDDVCSLYASCCYCRRAVSPPRRLLSVERPPGLIRSRSRPRRVAIQRAAPSRWLFRKTIGE